MSYAVKEIYYTIQGEGGQTGRPAIFCRFAGCNLWSGREEDRSTAICPFCDTDFFGTDGPEGGKFRIAASLVEAVVSRWPVSSSKKVRPLVVCTGGEPLLQLDNSLIQAFHKAGFEVAVETNGTLQPPDEIDWICVSPKSGADLVLRSGTELKLVFPQTGAMPEQYEDLSFAYFFLQPMDGPEIVENTKKAIQYCLENPQWRLSIQTHKLLGLR